MIYILKSGVLKGMGFKGSVKVIYSLYFFKILLVCIFLGRGSIAFTMFSKGSLTKKNFKGVSGSKKVAFPLVWQGDWYAEFDLMMFKES